MIGCKDVSNVFKMSEKLSNLANCYSEESKVKNAINLRMRYRE